MKIDQVRTTLRERIARGASLEELDTLLRMTRGLTERQRAALWSEAWRYDPRRVTLRRMEAARSLLGKAARPFFPGGRRDAPARNGNGNGRAGEGRRSTSNGDRRSRTNAARRAAGTRQA
jgi:hypothetical protein